MATVPPAPPPAPVFCGKQAPTPRTTPCPQHAAIPFRDPPIQETNHPLSEALHGAQGAEFSPSPVQNVPCLLHGQESTFSTGGANKWHPVQETNPAPQALSAPQPEQQDQQDTEEKPPGQDHEV